MRAPEPDLGARTGPLRGPDAVESVDDLDLHLGLPDNLIRDLDLLLLLRLLGLCLKHVVLEAKDRHHNQSWRTSPYRVCGSTTIQDGTWLSDGSVMALK